MNKKKKEIAKAMSEIIGHVLEALGKAYGCYIEIKSELNITPIRKKK